MGDEAVSGACLAGRRGFDGGAATCLVLLDIHHMNRFGTCLGITVERGRQAGYRRHRLRTMCAASSTNRDRPPDPDRRPTANTRLVAIEAPNLLTT
jgi:hypothetical protein